MKNYLNKIHKARLFVGSGTDDYVDPSLHTRLDKYGQYHADYSVADNKLLTKTVLNSDLSPDDTQIAKSIFEKYKGLQHDDKIGYYKNLYVGYVRAKSYRKNGSSGGMVSWLATKLLEDNKIDGFIHVKRSKTPGILFEYGISRTSKDIIDGAKSRYYPAQLSKVLEEVKQKPGRYAVVGIPEIITELRLLAEVDKTVKTRIKYYFGLVAGHQKTTKYAEAIAWEFGVKPGSLKDIDFRVKRKSGKAIQYDMRFTGEVLGKERTITVSNTEPFVASWAHGFFKARFSDFTDNSFNESADITFGDAWLEDYVGDPKGNNIVIVRDPALDKIVLSGIKKGELKLDMVASDVIARSQQGLIHHTRDELPYRLYKEIERFGWAPRKRVAPSSNLDPHRKKVQDTRQAIAENSHHYYHRAVMQNDFTYFQKKMTPYVNAYRKLYGQPDLRLPRQRERRGDGVILTLTGYYNYGNILQRYALQKFLKIHGFHFVSYVNNHSEEPNMYVRNKKLYLKTPFRFIKRFMNYEKPYWYIPRVSEIYPGSQKYEHLINFVNKYIDIKEFDEADNYRNYIVGSDQVWRNWWDNRETLGYYFLSFLKSRPANRIAYAASFGKDTISEVTGPEDAKYVEPYVQEFNHISVREKTAVSILQEVWGIKNAEVVVDPTLLLNKDDYSNLIENSESKYDDTQPIFTYVLGEDKAVTGFIERVQEVRRQAASGVRAHVGDDEGILPPIESWLKGFRDAELVVTNSFHGMMFSVVNNTDFIIIGREVGGLSRINDFIVEYGLEERFVDESELDNFDIANLKPINWIRVNRQLNKKREKSSMWLLNSIK